MEVDPEGNTVEEEEGWEATETKKNEMKEWFKVARPGDHLMTLFQCEICHFRNITGRNPNCNSEEDRWMIKCIVRANLDAFWARRPSTVQGNLRDMSKFMKILSDLRIPGPSTSFKRGPFEQADEFGMIPAVVSLQRSLDRGKNSKTIQWDTMRGMRSAYSNFIHTTPQGVKGAVLSDGKRSTHITESASNSIWFKRFMQGSHERMGDVKLQDAAMSIEVVLALQKSLRKELFLAKETGDKLMRFKYATLGAALVLGFSSALRGEELGHIRLHDTIVLTTQGLRHPTKRHVLLALEGRFKGMIARQRHKIPLCPVTASVIENEEWLVDLLLAYQHYDVVHGPLLRSRPTQEKAISIRQLDIWLHEALTKLQEENPSLVGNDWEAIQRFSFRRSLRRGSTTQARNKRVPKDVVVLNNRWRSQEQARGRFAQADMVDLYTDVVAALETLLQYSEAL